MGNKLEERVVPKPLSEKTDDGTYILYLDDVFSEKAVFHCNHTECEHKSGDKDDFLQHILDQHFTDFEGIVCPHEDCSEEFLLGREKLDSTLSNEILKKNLEDFLAHLAANHREKEAYSCRAKGCRSKFTEAERYADHLVKEHSLVYRLSCPFDCDQPLQLSLETDVASTENTAGQEFVHHLTETHSNTTVYKCLKDDCGQTSRTTDEIIEHWITHDISDDRYFQCPYSSCKDAHFPSVSEFEDHLMENHTIASGDCPVCEEWDPSSNLLDHICDMHSAVHVLECPVESCSDVLHGEDALSEHLRSGHSPDFVEQDTIYECIFPNCTEVFSQPDTLETHVKESHLSDTGSCVYCDSNDTAILGHLKEEHGERIHACLFPDCDHTAETESAAMEHAESDHLSTHDPDAKVYTCPITDCDKICETRNTFYDHVIQHTQQESTACLFCSEDGLQNLIIHIREDHVSTVHKECVLCDTTVLQEEARDHIEQEHEDDVRDANTPTLNCTACNRSFEDEKDAYNHVENEHDRIAKYHCPFCDKTDYFVRLRKHIETNHDEHVDIIRPLGAVKYGENEFVCPRDDHAANSIQQLVTRFNQEHYISDATEHDCGTSYIDVTIPCGGCNKEFSSAHEFRVHAREQPHPYNSPRMKSKIIDYTCPQCEFESSDIAKITTHINLKHTPVEAHFQRNDTFCCPICIRSFDDGKELVDHTEEDHDTQLTAYLLRNYGCW